MNKLEEIVNIMYQTPGDINENIPVLIKYGSECDSITEMGVRWLCSTWAFLGCAPKNGLLSIDMRNPDTWDIGGAGENQAIIQRGWNKLSQVYEVAEEFGLKFNFIQANVLDIEIEETDLLFLDTWHSYKQLKADHFKNNKDNWKRDHKQGGGPLRFYGIHLIAVLAELGYTSSRQSLDDTCYGSPILPILQSHRECHQHHRKPKHRCCCLSAECKCTGFHCAGGECTPLKV